MIVAIVPAAGLSRRMGRPKPLLEMGGMTLIARVIAALRDGGADRVVVVAPPAERAESAAIRREAEARGAEVVVLDRETSDMRASIAAALDRIEAITDVEAVLLTPADQPGIDGALVAGRRGGAAAGHDREAKSGTRGGHPIYLPWEVAAGIRRLPEGVGVKALLEGSANVAEVEVEDPGALADLDTPEDYRRWSP